MTSFRYRFENILTIRDKEKQDIEIAYKDSVRHFESVATKLYDLLKKKESTIESQQVKMQTGLSINEMHAFSHYLGSLEKSIDEAQQLVIQARSKMNWHEEKLIEMTIELKKYEKMKEMDFENFKKEKEREEMLVLDEMTTMSYRSEEIR